MAQYIVREGENLFDICLNAVGSLYDIDVVMDLNGIVALDHKFVAGESISVPSPRDSKVIDVANRRPFNSTFLTEEDLNDEIDYIYSLLE